MQAIVLWPLVPGRIWHAVLLEVDLVREPEVCGARDGHTGRPWWGTVEPDPLMVSKKGW